LPSWQAIARQPGLPQRTMDDHFTALFQSYRATLHVRALRDCATLATERLVRAH